MNYVKLFSAAAIVLSGIGGFTMHPAAADSLNGSQEIIGAPGGSGLSNQSPCANAASDSLDCAGPSVQGTLPDQEGVGGSSPSMVGGSGVISGADDQSGNPIANDYLTPGAPGSMQSLDAGSGD